MNNNNYELNETIKSLKENNLVKVGSYKFIGDSNITYAEINILISNLEKLQQETKNLIMNFNKVDFAKYFNISRPYLDKLLKIMYKEEVYNFLTLRNKIKED